MIWWPFGDSEVVAECRVDGAPIALIGLKTYNETDRIAVHGLVSHQTHLSAAIMIEWEVNDAKQPWSTINLYLHSLDDESTKFYKNTGFVEDDLAEKPGADELKYSATIWVRKRIASQGMLLNSRWVASSDLPPTGFTWGRERWDA